jgi:hypothetical protein
MLKWNEYHMRNCFKHFLRLNEVLFVLVALLLWSEARPWRYTSSSKHYCTIRPLDRFDEILKKIA